MAVYYYRQVHNLIWSAIHHRLAVCLGLLAGIRSDASSSRLSSIGQLLLFMLSPM